MVIIKKIYLFLYIYIYIYIYIHDGIYMTIKQIPVSMAREKLRRMSLKNDGTYIKTKEIKIKV